MGEADHCGDLLLMRDGHLVAHTTPTQLQRGHRMHVTGGRVSVHHQTDPSAKPGRPAGVPKTVQRHHVADSAATGWPTLAASR